jgi:hypothetical protein
MVSKRSMTLPESPMTEAHKRALIIAYYLSRFDRKGVRALGYATFEEAFKTVGETIGVPPATVKHMRDSFDPYCSHVRVGWYQRKVLPSRANVIQAYDAVGEDAMAEIVREILGGSEQAYQTFIAPISGTDDTVSLPASNEAFANRLRTGEKAEEFFMREYPNVDMFRNGNLEDTRKLGIGFDFRVSFDNSFLAVEVKGILDHHGYISFTDKEWSVAHILEGGFILALVRSLNHEPILDLMPHPTQHLDARIRTIESVSICWNARV